jgi:hypothetical protein
MGRWRHERHRSQGLGLQYQVLDTGGLLVGDKVDIDFDSRAVKAAAVEAA